MMMMHIAHRPPSVQKGKNILVIFSMISKAGQKRAGRIWSWKRRGRLCEPFMPRFLTDFPEFWTSVLSPTFTFTMTGACLQTQQFFSKIMMRLTIFFQEDECHQGRSPQICTVAKMGCQNQIDLYRWLLRLI